MPINGNAEVGNTSESTPRPDSDSPNPAPPGKESGPDDDGAPLDPASVADWQEGPPDGDDSGPPLRDAQAIIQHRPDAVLVVDRADVWIQRRTGTWLELGRGYSPVVTGALQHLIRDVRNQAGNGAPVSYRSARESAAELSIAIDGDYYGVRHVTTADLDAHPILPLRNGGGVDLRTASVIDAESLPLFLLRDMRTGMDYRPELLGDPPRVCVDAVAHYGELLFRRLAWLLLAPHKAIDTVRLPVSNAGKTTLCQWLQAALPGVVATVDAVHAFSANGLRFPVMARALASYRLVLADEADKIDKPPPVAAVNGLTAPDVTVELKGEDSTTKPRRGNAVFVGADWPVLVQGQGTDTRMNWAYDRADIPQMPYGMRDALLGNPDCTAWLAAYLVDLAASLHRMDGAAESSTHNEDTRQAAADLGAVTADPLVSALEGLLEPDPVGFVAYEDLRAKLPPEIGAVNNRAWLPAIQRIAPNARTDRPRSHGRRWGASGVRFYQEAAEGETRGAIDTSAAA